MGWMGINDKGSLTPIQYLSRKWELNTENDKMFCLDASMINFREVYMVMERRTNNEVKRFMVVTLVEFNTNGCEMMYKDMDETCGPSYYNAPERLMKLLEGYPSPYEGSYAKGWREEVWNRINAKKKDRKLLPKLLKNIEKGDTVFTKNDSTFVYKGLYRKNSILIAKSTGPQTIYRMNKNRIDVEKTLMMIGIDRLTEAALV